ncbi:putative disease resistance RPP13-like protein 3 [Brachypodium distachyon]|uniref:Disease resistance protein RPM1 n=1 Tax=Brachypodium distachyon TaxID=15368 RepID=I1H1V7_BRADI|nr:putative disease resistance RPP13-like protein 3 [Brachypodium distachyon]KQK19987.1 hypothetical protein BRADI_1g51687v3 [Brachypodium distachyon]|eukprot:XP_003561215.1 putative disease resistance RPP13-like protein 3 [Brachypodium distachyon]
MEVVSAADGALGPLLGKLATLLAEEYSRLKGVRGEIRSLKSELTSMHGALKKYTMIEDPDVQVKTWISLLRELAYDTEDCFDKFIHHLGGGGGNHGGCKEFFCKIARSLKTLGHRHGLADQIDELKARIKEVKELKSSYKLDDIASSNSNHGTVDPRLGARFNDNLVGIDGPTNDLAKWMMEENSSSTKLRRKVLSIVGFGGLGKTTLANEVCIKIEGHFDCRAFVSISQNPDMKKIVKDLIHKVPCPKDFTKGIDTWDEITSIEKLRNLLQDKRYLIIVDDVWSISAWNAIKCVFPENNRSSRIIATTRIFDVAKSCSLGTDDHIYELKPLNGFHSERLFHKTIFGSEDGCPDMLREISNEILKKCGGLPLAINSISGLLARIPTNKQEWEKVKRSIGSDLSRSQSLEGMKNILSLSYNVLPGYLKTCLLYLSIFPEDYVIDKERLVRRWIAEGFISEERGQSKQDVAEKYFYELINKNMVQPVDIGHDGKARACRVHDMMLELIISKSAEENFITVVGSGQKVLANRQGFIRRLSIQDIDQEVASVLENEDLSHVRSLTVTRSGCIKYLPSLGKFEALRVLDFEDCDDIEEYDMSPMDKLFQLKFVSFKNTYISELPSGIVTLHGLETLDLRNTYIDELPAGIDQLIKLQHLLTESGPYRYRYRHGRMKVPNGIGNMRSLQVVSGFNISLSSVGAVEELGNLNTLNELHVQLDDADNRCADMLLSSVCRLGTCKLQCFWISSDDSTSLEFLDSWSPLPSSLQVFGMTTNYYFPKIPKWITPALTNLTYLLLIVSDVTQEELHMLGELPGLIYLELWLERGKTRTLAVQGRGFQCLKELHFRVSFYGTATINFVFMEGALPNLEKLDVPLSAATENGYYFGIVHLASLKDAKFRLDTMGATYSELKAASVAIRNETDAHRNPLRVTIVGLGDESDDECDDE